jgi:hypothetical protein
MQATDSAAWTLVQPTGRRREWELRDGDGPLARLRIPTFRSGAEAEIGDRRLRIQRLGSFRGGYAVLDESAGGEIARLRRGGRQQVLDLEGVSYRWQRVGRRFGFVRDDGESLVGAKVRSALSARRARSSSTRTPTNAGRSWARSSRATC